MALTAAIAVSLLALSGAGGAATQQTPKLGGTIAVEAGLGEPPCLNPLVASCDPSSPGMAFPVEKVLLPAFDVDARFTFRPRLVSSVTVSPRPPFTLTYHIQPKARWSDGVSVTAADFLFTHAVRLAHSSSLPPDQQASLRHVQGVVALDPKTVRVTLREPFAGWQTLFPNVLPRHVLLGQDLSKIWVDRIDDPRTGQPIGSGPFLIDSFERGKALTLVRNPRYWGPHLARVDHLVLRYHVQDDVDALRKGDIDLVLGAFGPQVAPLANDPEFRTGLAPFPGYEHLAMREGQGGHPALRNPLVRRALAYGVDRLAILRALGVPHGRPVQSVVYLAQSPYERANWTRYSHRPALARSLLVRAGCKRGADGIFSCAGRRLSLRFLTSAGIPPRQVVLQTVQAQLRKVGIEVVPTYVAPPVFTGTVLPKGRYDVALFGWLIDPTATGASSIYSCRGVDNYTGYCSTPVTREFARASRTLDPAAQARILNAADRMIAADAPVLPLFQITPTDVVRTSVRAFVKLPYNPLADAENWWLDR